MNLGAFSFITPSLDDLYLLTFCFYLSKVSSTLLYVLGPGLSRYE